MLLKFGDATTPQMQERLAVLRKKFIDGIPRRLNALDASTSLTERMHVVHQLAGAALSYKAQALGELARSIEAALAAGTVTDWPERLAALHAEFRKLEGGDG